MLRHIYRREMAALKKGQELKTWTIPEFLRARVTND
jgi:hypothetical protein